MEEEECISSRTLMISGVPEGACSKELVNRHLAEAYPGRIEVEDVQVREIKSFTNLT